MTMWVDPHALRTFAHRLGNMADDALAARDYVVRYGELSWPAEGWLATARAVHGDFLATLTGQLDHLRVLASSSTIELVKAAEFYERTDRAAAGRLDQTYPQAPRSLDSPV
ncbi:MAG: type VII secretion target [Betaproteobacteria bacterium]